MPNRLIDQSRLAREQAAAVSTQREIDMAKKDKPEVRCMLYQGGPETGRVFEGEAAIEAAKKDGWKDQPKKGSGQQGRQHQQGRGGNDSPKPGSSVMDELNRKLAAKFEELDQVLEELFDRVGALEKGQQALIVDAEAAKGKSGKGGAGK